MKIAIALTGKSEDANVSSHFGQSEFFMIYDESTGRYDFIDNPGRGMKGCVGEICVKALAETNVKRVLAGDFGTVVQQLLNANHMQMILYPDESGSAKDIISYINNK